ncbi:MAG: PIN domain-containing protein [Sideroxydans sp.]|nr:PIN domain-containing protein [Sideroxydans sp.]
MTALRFVDTNILIYAHDRDAGIKHDKARQILIDLWNQENGCLSAQVLQEFFVNVTKKIPQPLPTAVAREVMRIYLPWVRTVSDGEMVIRASEIADAWQTSFWDGMIIAAAERSGASELLTEDLQSGQRIAGLIVINPFAVN